MSEEVTTTTETALIRTNPATDPAVELYREEVTRAVTCADTRVVATDDDVRLATDDLSMLAKLGKSVEAKRKEYVDPLNAHLKIINEAFKQVSVPIDNAITITKKKILEYKTEQQVKAGAIKKANDMRIEAARIEAQANGGEISQSVELTPEPSVLPKTVTSNIGATSTVVTWHARVVDFVALPNEYKIANQQMLDTLAKQIKKNGMPTIAGVEFYQETDLRVNARVTQCQN